MKIFDLDIYDLINSLLIVQLFYDCRGDYPPADWDYSKIIHFTQPENGERRRIQ